MIRVLIADSNPNTQEQLRSHLLSDPELEIVGLARDGHEALQLAHHYRPDIAILSADLTVHDGFQTAEYLHGVGYLPTQIILISDIDTSEQRSRAIDAGAREHVSRPVDKELILTTIHEIYDEEQREYTPSFPLAADAKHTRIPVTNSRGERDVSTPSVVVGTGMFQGPTALLVMDYQEGIVSHFRGSDLLDRAARAIAAARAAKIPVIYVVAKSQVGSRDESENKLFGKFETKIHSAVAPLPDDIVVTKWHIGAFSGTDLDIVLRSQGVTSLVLAGITTGGVVLSTVISATDTEYQITVLSDCCADSDEEVHRILVEKVFPRQARVITGEAWAQGI